MIVGTHWDRHHKGTAFYGKDASAAVRMAIDNGITHLDGAQMYTNEETLVSLAHSYSRR